MHDSTEKKQKLCVSSHAVGWSQALVVSGPQEERRTTPTLSHFTPVQAWTGLRNIWNCSVKHICGEHFCSPDRKRKEEERSPPPPPKKAKNPKTKTKKTGSSPGLWHLNEDVQTQHAPSWLSGERSEGGYAVLLPIFVFLKWGRAKFRNLFNFQRVHRSRLAAGKTNKQKKKQHHNGWTPACRGRARWWKGPQRDETGHPVSYFSSSCFLCCSHRASRWSALFRAAYQRREHCLKTSVIPDHCAFTSFTSRHARPVLPRAACEDCWQFLPSSKWPISLW